MFQINLNTFQVSVSTPDVSSYTFSAVHFDPVTKQLFALSPGLVPPKGPTFPHVPAVWSLITLDPETGATKLIATLSKGEYLNYYGGEIVQTLSESNRNLRGIFYDSNWVGYVIKLLLW